MRETSLTRDELRIAGDRVYLRPLSDEDCNERYVAWLNDPEVTRYLETRFAHQDQTTVKAFVQRMNASSRDHLFGIIDAETERHIGNIKVGPVAEHHPIADVSLFIGDKLFWSRGRATDAIRAVSVHAFGALGLRKLSAGMYAANQGSFRAFLKAGYRHEGTRRAHYRLGDTMTDLILVGLIPEDLAGGP